MSKVTQKVYEQRKQIAEDIARSMKSDGLEWLSPFARLQMPRNGKSGRHYNGRNIGHLIAAMRKNGYTDPRFYTFLQAKELGYRVRKGERSHLIEKWAVGTVKVGENPDDGTEIFAKVPVFQRAYNMFNAEQLDGVDDWTGRNEELDDAQTVAIIDRLVSSSRCPVKEGADEAYYAPKSDRIQIPSRHLYAKHDGSAQAFLRVLLHEMVHSTGKVLGRDIDNKFGSADYAREELVADLGSVFAASSLGFVLDFSNTDDEFAKRHIAYLKHWGDHLADNTDELFRAVGKASKAADYIVDRYYKSMPAGVTKVA